jgi:hypothetical protein
LLSLLEDRLLSMRARIAFDSFGEPTLSTEGTAAGGVPRGVVLGVACLGVRPSGTGISSTTLASSSKSPGTEDRVADQKETRCCSVLGTTAST